MGPGKSPVFAVCGGVSVETVVVGVGRRRSSVKAARRSSVAGLAESLYADLLWDCGGGNVEDGAAAASRLSTETVPQEDFTDVFGGPPKFASVSSQLSFKRGMARVSDAWTNGASVFQPFVSEVPPVDRTPAFDAFNGLPRLCTSQEAHGNPAPMSNSVKIAKLRSTTEAKYSSRICYSDSDKKNFIKRKEEAAYRVDEISPTVPPEPCAGARIASTTMRRRESSRSDVGKDAKGTRVLNPSQRDLSTRKESMQACFKGLGGEPEGQVASVHARMASSSRAFEEASQKSCSTQKFITEGWKRNLKIKGNADDLWVTIKDVQFATEPSRFPPPSRPPPGFSSDAVCIIRNTHKNMKIVDDWPKRCSQALQKESNSDTGSLSSPCTQESFTIEASNSKDVKDAVEMAEAKIRMVLEARGKAKLMVEKKLREKQRARQHKERISAAEGKLGIKHNCKEHMTDLREEKEKLKVQHCEDNVDRQEAEGARKRDIARQCIERATRELRSKSAAIIQERAAESRVSHDSSERPVEDGQGDCSAMSAVDKITAEATPRAEHCWPETNAGPQKRCSRKAGLEKVFVEDDIFVSREQQQDSLTSLWYSTERQRFCESASLERVGSMSRTHDDWNLFPGGNSFLIDFHEIIGETLERRKARWDRHCRTAARMAKALEEKNLRDLEHQKEQAERHRAGEMLDEEIKGWAAGKEGNLEALICSLHYVLWPECGWGRVSPADLVTAAALKKAYRRATLCVHPDKVQQKGATVAQKYIAEKIFDLLKEASAKYI